MNVELLKRYQYEDGSFGPFHSMSTNGLMTTERALRRFYHLSLSKDHELVKSTLNYVIDCLEGKKAIPDREEKVIDWHIFKELMFASWLTIFNVSHEKVNIIKDKWKKVIESSITNYIFSDSLYEENFQRFFGKRKPSERIINPTTFYPVNLLVNYLSEDASEAYFDYIMKTGIYYIYDKNLLTLPSEFDSKQNISYLEVIRLASFYANNKSKLDFVRKWILSNQASDGNWYVNIKPDGIIFPYSSSWRKKEDKLRDFKCFMNKILNQIT